MLIYLIGFSKGIYWYTKQAEPTDCRDGKDQMDTSAHCHQMPGITWPVTA